MCSQKKLQQRNAEKSAANQSPACQLCVQSLFADGATAHSYMSHCTFLCATFAHSYLCHCTYLFHCTFICIYDPLHIHICATAHFCVRRLFAQILLQLQLVPLHIYMCGIVRLHIYMCSCTFISALQPRLLCALQFRV